jgi:hypothetical protein
VPTHRDDAVSPYLTPHGARPCDAGLNGQQGMFSIANDSAFGRPHTMHAE